MTDEPDTHYGDLREVRNELIDTHRGLKARIASDEYDGSYIRQQRRQAEDVGRRDGLIEAISEIEDVLNEWIERDDRDGEVS